MRASNVANILARLVANGRVSRSPEGYRLLSRDAAVSASRLYRIVRKRKRETRRLRVLKSGRADHKAFADPRPRLRTTIVCGHRKLGPLPDQPLHHSQPGLPLKVPP